MEQDDLVVIPPYTSISVASGDDDRPFHYLSLSFEWKVGILDFARRFRFPRKLHIPDLIRLASFREGWRALLGKWDALLAELPMPPFTRRPSEIELNTRQSAAYLEIHGMFYLWATHLLQLAEHAIPPHPKQMDPRVETVCSYVDTRYADKITTQDLCSKVFISESQLRLLFKNNLAVSPMEYILQVRLNKAKELLLETNRPIGEIARSVGFDDISYFIRVFRRKERITPAQYRRRVSTA
jgi:AraC-like DNA-binding protein